MTAGRKQRSWGRQRGGGRGPSANQAGAIATLNPSPGRRATGIGMLVILGAVLAYVGISAIDDLAAGASLLALGATAFWAAQRLRVSTRESLELRGGGLYSTDGSLVAEIGNVARVDLGIFAMRPTGGFLLVLKSPMPKAWKPGLWWRFGKRVGIGGVTSKAEAKAMAEALARLVRSR